MTQSITPKDAACQNGFLSEQCLHAVLDNLNPSILVGLLTKDGRVTYANRTALELIDKDLAEVLGQPFPSTPWWQFSGEAREQLRNAIKAAPEHASHFEHLLRDHLGELHTMDFWLYSLFNTNDELVALVASAQDITQRKAAETALRHTQFAVDHAYGAIFELAADGRLRYVNEAACKLLGYSRGDLMNLSIGQIDADLSEEGWGAQWNKLKSESALHFESLFRHRDGHNIPVEVSAVYLEHEGDHYGFVYAEDISERKAAEERIAYMTYHDSLTGLPNRALLKDRLDLAIRFAALHHSRLAVMFIGLDRFKLVNDTLGTACGDQVLRIAAERISSCMQPIDTVSRVSADEFVALHADGQDQDGNAEETANRILDAFLATMDLPGHQLVVSCSIGVAGYPDGGTEADELLKNAYAALQRAKAHGGNSVSIYSSSSSRRDPERLSLEAALRRAPEHRELLVYYQPQVELSTGRIVGAEALLRWHPPHGEMISPARFIPIAEETGLIIPIGEWVLRTACSRIKAWCHPGSALGRIAVNLSARQFRSKDLVKLVTNVLKEFDIDPICLELELTETMLMEDIDSAIRTMVELKALGVHVALDDFGTGYSSLSYLRRLPVEALKIDKSFIHEITVDRNSIAISDGIITLAHQMGLNVIAEGVETESQFEVLQAIGCKIGQGHLFSRPLPEEEFTTLIANFPPNFPLPRAYYETGNEAV